MVPAAAAGAAEAIALLRESHDRGQPFQLVLTDAHMPEVDGFMLAEQIRGDPALGETVIMMLTSGDHPEDVKQCEALGIVAYLLKPIKQSELLEAIELATGAAQSRTRLTSDSGKPAHVGRLRVLLAEDSLVNQKLAVALLEDQGHAVVVVGNGREAVSAVQAEMPDLVLMDVQMPEMDGLEATERIRGWEQRTGTRVPIVAMTAHALKGDRERCLAAGMDAYVAKPIRADELFAAIYAQFRAPTAAVPPVQSPASKVEGAAIDWGECLRGLQGNARLLRLVAETAVEEIPRLGAAIRGALESGDARALRLNSHTLKGSLHYFGNTAAYQRAVELERLGQERKLGAAAAALDRLDGELLQVVAEMREFLTKAG
jgi:two-component system, sensor histidine kinase and response regulator